MRSMDVPCDPGSLTHMFPSLCHVFSYLYQYGLSTRLPVMVSFYVPLSSRRLVYAYCYLLRLPVVVRQLVISGLWLVYDLSYFLRLLVLVSCSSLYIRLKMGIRPSSSIYFATTLKVWPVRSHELSLILSSLLAKATALRILAGVNSPPLSTRLPVWSPAYACTFVCS